MAIACDTSGASIAYREDKDKQWQLYTNLIPLSPAAVRVAKAYRLGFSDNDEMFFSLDASSADASLSIPVSQATLHWCEQLSRTRLLDRLLAIKALKKELHPTLMKTSGDPSPVACIAAAHTLCEWGWDEDLTVLEQLLRHENEFVCLYAMNALRHLDEKAKPVLDPVKKHSATPPAISNELLEQSSSGLAKML